MFVGGVHSDPVEAGLPESVDTSSSYKGHSQSSPSSFSLYRFYVRNRLSICLLGCAKVFLLIVYVLYSVYYSPPALHAKLNSHITCDASTPKSELPSIFCFAFAVPAEVDHGVEVGLLKSHLENNLLSGCDQWAIYSNVTPTILLSSSIHLPGAAIFDGPVGTNRRDDQHTQYHTAANTPQLSATWHHVLNYSPALEHDWTVKIDADTVINPDRLRCLLSYYKDNPKKGDGPRPMFLAKPSPNSIGGGTVVGQMEVLNTAALRLFRRSFLECQIIAEGQHLASLAEVMYEGTEDGWFETCMYVLGVQKVVEPNLMGDVRKKVRGKRVEGCESNVWFAGYYPVKDVKEFVKCARTMAAVDETLAPGAIKKIPVLTKLRQMPASMASRQQKREEKDVKIKPLGSRRGTWKSRQ